MRRSVLFCVLLVSLALAFVGPSSSSAASPVLTIEQPTYPTPATARLTGTASGTTQVRLEVWMGNRWGIDTGVVPVVAGRYAVFVPAATTPTRYRVAYMLAKSAEVTVVGAPVQTPASIPASNPSPDPTPIPDQGSESATAAQSDACGPQPKKVDGTFWTCTLADDFNGTTLNRSVWMPQTVFRSGSATAWACYLDDPSVVNVQNGALNLSVRKLPQSRPCAGQRGEMTPYVAGSVSTYRLFSQQYGRFEARFKSTAATSPGLHEAFWLWPDDRYNTAYWPMAGEIDIAETYSQYKDLVVPFLHYSATDNGGPVPTLNTAWNCVAHRGEYNTYALEWTATRLQIQVNGKTCLVNTSGDPAFKKPYIIALTQLLGLGGNEVRPATPIPATMSVDYVRVWK